MSHSVLVFGRSGQVAQELAAIAWPQNWTVQFLGRDVCDLAVPGSASSAIRSNAPDIVINAAAYTAVDRAETDRDAAYALNADAPGEMAAAASTIGAALVHISTDYVFDGEGPHPYTEQDQTAPRSVYGASKAAGEERVRSSLDRHVILRTSWVFSDIGTNFLRTMLRLGAERDELAIVSDQIGGPTGAGDIAAAIARIAKGLDGNPAFGTFHYAGAPVTSWHGFARAIFAGTAEKGLRTPRMVREITTANYPTPARRPRNSRLDCNAIRRDWGIEQPSWERALDGYLEKLTGGHVPVSRELR